MVSKQICFSITKSEDFLVNKLAQINSCSRSAIVRQIFRRGLKNVDIKSVLTFQGEMLESKSEETLQG